MVSFIKSGDTLLVQSKDKYIGTISFINGERKFFPYIDV